MPRRTEALRAILQQPLDYLHPQRGVVPALFGEPATRALLNQSLLRRLALSCPDPQQLKRNPWTDCWIANWQQLPVVSRLMGAHLMWPRLARGARMRELNAPTRAFARIDLGNRPMVAVSEADGLEQSLSALGLAALTAWHQHIPEALMQRLFLQFSPPVVEFQQTLPLLAPNPSLLSWRYNMLESIRTLEDIPSTDALLLRHEERTAARNRRLLMQQARERAKSCMEEAQQEADSVRANAFQDGYSQGVLQAAADVSGLLLRSRLMASALQAELAQAARSLLGDLLMDEQLLDALLQRWQDGWVGQGREPLQIILPLRCKAQQPALKSKLTGLGIERVDIRFHAQERYLFRLADQVVELDIGATQERLSPRLIAQLKQLPESVRELDEASRRVLVSWAADLNKGAMPLTLFLNRRTVMNIDSYSLAGPGHALPRGTEAIVPLDQRMGLQGGETRSDPDPDFAQFYDEFMKWIASTTPSPGSIQGYLKQYANASGELPYKTTQKQMDALTQVMVRMKEQGLEESDTYKEIRVALVSVSSANMFVKEFMQEVFKPSEDEDSRENISW